MTLAFSAGHYLAPLAVNGCWNTITAKYAKEYTQSAQRTVYAKQEINRLIPREVKRIKQKRFM